MDLKLGNFELIPANILYFYIIIEYEKEIHELIPQNYDYDEITFYDLLLLFGKFKFFKNLLEGFLYNQFIYYNCFIQNKPIQNNNKYYLLNLRKDLFKYSNLLNNLYEKFNLNDLNSDFEKLIKSKNKIYLKKDVINKIKANDYNDHKLYKIQLQKTQNFYNLNNNNFLFNDIIINIFNSNPNHHNELLLLKNQVKHIKNNLKLKIEGSLLFIYINQINILKFNRNQDLMINFMNVFEKNNISEENNFDSILKILKEIIKRRDALINDDIEIHKNLMKIYMKRKNWYMNDGFYDVQKKLKLEIDTIIKWWKFQNKIYIIKLKNKLFKNEIEREEYLRFGDIYFKKEDFPSFNSISEKRDLNKNNLLEKKEIKNIINDKNEVKKEDKTIKIIEKNDYEETIKNKDDINKLEEKENNNQIDKDIKKYSDDNLLKFLFN